MKKTKNIVAGITATVLTLTLIGAWNSSQTPARAENTAGAAPPITGTWAVDPAHTNINFSIRHFGISQVHGRFDDFAGTIVADGAHPEKSSVQFSIQTAGINTNVKMRDDDLRSANYFDAAKYSQITFQSTSITRGRRGNFVAQGNLKIHGVTKQVALPFNVSGPIKDPFGGTRFGLETEVHVNRLDYGVGDGKKLTSGDFAIGNDVDVIISLEAVPAKPTV